jgi:hypothetical protein
MSNDFSLNFQIYLQFFHPYFITRLLEIST